MFYHIRKGVWDNGKQVICPHCTWGGDLHELIRERNTNKKTYYREYNWLCPECHIHVDHPPRGPIFDLVREGV